MGIRKALLIAKIFSINLDSSLRCYFMKVILKATGATRTGTAPHWFITVCSGERESWRKMRSLYKWWFSGVGSQPGWSVLIKWINFETSPDACIARFHHFCSSMCVLHCPEFMAPAFSANFFHVAPPAASYWRWRCRRRLISSLSPALQSYATKINSNLGVDQYQPSTADLPPHLFFNGPSFFG